MKLLSVVGTRPNFLKESALQHALAKTDIEEVLVHTGQHYDYEMSQIFFDEMEIPRPKYHADVPSVSSTHQLASMLPFLEELIDAERPDATLVYGDVTSTAAGAWASARRGIPVAHVEAGVRTLARFNPEEINRRVADHLSDTLFPNIQESYENLMRENFASEDVFLPGDIVMDIVLDAVERFTLEVSRRDYCLATVHRAENATCPDRLGAIIDGLVASGRRIVFPAHPRTRETIEKNGLHRKLANSRVELLSPQGYRAFATLMAGADKVISDSGGVRREAYILGKPVISLTELVWVPSMVTAGWERVIGADADKIAQSIVDFEPPSERPPIFGDGHAARRIVDTLLDRYGAR